jgi:DNA-binding transcriptional ArsR family regulator
MSVSDNLPLVQTYYKQLDAISDATRRTVLERLRYGPLPVGELAKGLPVSRPAVSQHLKVLKEAQMVRDEAVGTRRFYRLERRGFDALRDYFDSFWDEALQAFRERVEE